MAHRDTPGGPVFLCLWANMWSRSSRPYQASRNCHENGRSETVNGDFQGHKSALILRAACALVHTKNRAAGRSDSPPPENFLKPVCGISVVKRKITPVFTKVIFSLVDLKGIEPSNLTDANRALSQLSYRPKSALFMRKSCEFWISQIFDFQGKVQQIGQENGKQKIGSDVSHYGCERSALPAELRAQIGTIRAKKVANFGFLKYSIFRGKSNKSDRKTGNRKSGRMCLTMDANRALSQLSYRPIFQQRYIL